MNAQAREWLDARARETFGVSLDDVRQRVLALSRNFLMARKVSETRIQISERDFAMLAFMAMVGSDAIAGTETRDVAGALGEVVELEVVESRLLSGGGE